jgi:uncharacterized DUF497 family protein
MKKSPDFEWNDKKDELNQQKHGVSFALAQIAFLDLNRVILEDLWSIVERRHDTIAWAESLVEL